MVYNEAKYRANTKYNKKTYKDIKIRIRKDNEQDINKNDNKKKEVLYMEKSEDTIVRKSYLLSKKVADEWKIFNEKIPYNSVVLDYALSRTMSDIKNGNVQIEFRF